MWHAVNLVQQLLPLMGSVTEKSEKTPMETLHISRMLTIRPQIVWNWYKAAGLGVHTWRIWLSKQSERFFFLALSGCCNKMEFPPHPSSSGRHWVRRMFFSFLTDISLSVQAARRVARNSSQLRATSNGIFYNLEDAHGGGQEGERQRKLLSKKKKKKASCSSF